MANLTPSEQAIVSKAQLLRPRQLQASRDELVSVEAKLRQETPWDRFQNASVDRAEAQRYKQSLEAKLERETPVPFEPGERDLAVSAERKLADSIREGMPSGAEMRRNPAGAVDKHGLWEARKKGEILTWKNLRQRMLATGMIEGEVDASNVEMLRSHDTGAQQLNMHNEQIPGADYYIPKQFAVKNVMEPADRERHRQELVQIQLDAFRQGRDKSKQSLARRTLTSMFGEQEADRLISQAKSNGKPS